MLIFGPYRAIPKDEDLVVFNLTSPVESIPRLPGLFVQPPIESTMNEEAQYQFDLWYYDYVINDPMACGSLMSILSALYNGNKVYICIADYITSTLLSIVNESFMKIIQTRYDIKYSIVNEPEDFLYLREDGCDFASVNGIQMFDLDRMRYIQLIEEQKIIGG